MVREAMRHRTKQGLAFLVTMVGLFLALDGGMYLYANWRMQQVADAYATCRRSPNYQFCSVFYPDLIANTQKEIANLRTTLTIGLFGLMFWVMFKNHFFVGKNEEPVASWKQPQRRSAATVELKQEPKLSQELGDKRSGKGVNKGAILASALIIGVSTICLAYLFTATVPLPIVYTLTSTAPATDTYSFQSSYVGYVSTSSYAYTSCTQSYYLKQCRTSSSSYTFPIWITKMIASQSFVTTTFAYRSTSVTTMPLYSINPNPAGIALLMLVAGGTIVFILRLTIAGSSPKPTKSGVRLATAGETKTPSTIGPTKFCRECGAKIPRDSIFCEECGKRIG
jgi:hypothetical protein